MDEDKHIRLTLVNDYFQRHGSIPSAAWSEIQQAVGFIITGRIPQEPAPLKAASPVN